jgi:sodium/bile acid cotransporter 7
MLVWVAKRWFLVLLTAAIGLACVFPEELQPGASRLSPLVVVAPALLFMAWSLDSRSLARTLSRPWAACWAVVISFGVVPALGLLAGSWLSNPELRIGLLIVTSVPCTLASAVLWTRMAHGNEATALLAVLLTIATSWLATTSWLVFGTGTVVDMNPTGLMGELLLVLVIPVSAGQLLRGIRPLGWLATSYRRGLGVVSQMLILVIIVKAAVDSRLKLTNRLDELGGTIIGAALACVGIHLTALLCGFWSSRALGLDRPNQVAVAFAGSQKTLPVALYLFEAHFQSAPLAVVPLVFYHGSQLILDTFIADYLANRRAS